MNANAVQVQLDNATLCEVVTRDQVHELPLNGRNLCRADPIATSVSQANNFGTKYKAILSGMDFSVNGNASTSNLFLVDEPVTMT